MTNRERLISLLGFEPSNSNTIDGSLLDFGITSSETYAASNIIPIKKAAISVLEILLSTADTKNENGYEIKYDRDAIEKRLQALKNEVGLSEIDKPTVIGKSVW